MNINQGGGRQADSLDALKTWWNECPLFTRSMVYICTGAYLLDFFMMGYLGAFIINIPYLTVQGLQLWRLFLSPFFSSGLLGLIFGFLVFLPLYARKEREWGTVKTIVDFVYKNFLINVAFIALAYLLSMISPAFLLRFCFGLWPIYFYYLTERCLQDPTGTSQLFCFPVHIRNTLYPIVLFLLFSLLSQMILIDLLVAIAVGFVHFNHLNNRYHAYLNEQRMSYWEHGCLFNFMRTGPNYVAASGNMFANRGAPAQQSSNDAPNNDAPRPVAPFSAFGGKGVTLGGADQQEPNHPGPNGRNNERYAELNDNSDDLEQGRSPASN